MKIKSYCKKHTSQCLAQDNLSKKDGDFGYCICPGSSQVHNPSLYFFAKLQTHICNYTSFLYLNDLYFKLNIIK